MNGTDFKNVLQKLYSFSLKTISFGFLVSHPTKNK